MDKKTLEKIVKALDNHFTGCKVEEILVKKFSPDYKKFLGYEKKQVVVYSYEKYPKDVRFGKPLKVGDVTIAKYLPCIEEVKWNKAHTTKTSKRIQDGKFYLELNDAMKFLPKKILG